MKKHIMATRWSVILATSFLILNPTMRQGKTSWMQSPTQKMRDGRLRKLVGGGNTIAHVVKTEANNMKKDILNGLSEIYFYHCHKCGERNLSRDEIHQVEGVKFICLECERKEDGEDEMRYCPEKSTTVDIG